MNNALLFNISILLNTNEFLRADYAYAYAW